MKKIVHISTVHPANDIRVFHKECTSLAAAGFDVTLIARSDGDARRNAVDIISLRRGGKGRLGRWSFTAAEALAAAWRLGARVYHFHDPELMLLGGLLRLSGSKVVYDVHEDTPSQILSKDWIPKMLRRPLSLGINALEVFLARFVYSGIVAATPDIARRFPRNKTCEVQNFPDLNELTTPHPALPMTERPMTAVYVGGLTRIRGVLELVRAMEYVGNEEARLVLMGTFKDNNFERLLRTQRSWRNVDFTGWQNRKEVAALLGRARAGLVTFHPEPNHLSAWPNKMFEYMAAGLPLIASDFPLWRSIVERFQCGLLVDPRDEKAIARAISWIFDHPGEAEAMGERGRRAVETTYNWLNEQGKLIAFYERLLSDDVLTAKRTSKA